MRAPRAAPAPIATVNESAPARAAAAACGGPAPIRYSTHTESTPRLSVTRASSGTGSRSADCAATGTWRTTGGVRSGPTAYAYGACAPAAGSVAASPGGVLAADTQYWTCVPEGSG